MTTETKPDRERGKLAEFFFIVGMSALILSPALVLLAVTLIIVIVKGRYR